jgi:hypothetical protein
VADDDNGRWVDDRIAHAPILGVVSEWPADATMIFSAQTFRTAVPGTELRDLSCLRCAAPVQGQPFQVWVLVSPYPCQNTGDHLAAVAGLTHIMCAGLDPVGIAGILEARSAACFGQ